FSPMHTDFASAPPALMMVANAVAAWPTCGERLPGKTDETMRTVGGSVLSNAMASSPSTERPKLVMCAVALSIVTRLDVRGPPTGVAPYRVPAALKARAVTAWNRTPGFMVAMGAEKWPEIRSIVRSGPVVYSPEK